VPGVITARWVGTPRAEIELEDGLRVVVDSTTQLTNGAGAGDRVVVVFDDQGRALDWHTVQHASG
jgi:hypothetical protein